MASLVAAAKLEIRVLHVLKGGAEVVGQVREGRAVELVSHPLIIGAVRDALKATDLAHDCQSSLRQHFRGLKGKSKLTTFLICERRGSELFNNCLFLRIQFTRYFQI